MIYFCAWRSKFMTGIYFGLKMAKIHKKLLEQMCKSCCICILLILLINESYWVDFSYLQKTYLLHSFLLHLETLAQYCTLNQSREESFLLVFNSAFVSVGYAGLERLFINLIPWVFPSAVVEMMKQLLSLSLSTLQMKWWLIFGFFYSGWIYTTLYVLDVLWLMNVLK